MQADRDRANRQRVEDTQAAQTPNMPAECPSCGTERIIGRHSKSDCIAALRAELKQVYGLVATAEADVDRMATKWNAASYLLIQSEAERDAMRLVVDAAVSVSDADLSVYIDVPEGDRLMDALDVAVDAYRAEQDERRRDSWASAEGGIAVAVTNTLNDVLAMIDGGDTREPCRMCGGDGGWEGGGPCPEGSYEQVKCPECDGRGTRGGSDEA